MSNEGTPAVPEKKRRGLVRKILSAAVVTVLVLLAVAMVLFPDYFNVDALRRMIRYMNVGGGSSMQAYEFDAHNSNRYAGCDGGLAVASVGGLSLYGPRGEAVISQAQLNLPDIRTGNRTAMAFDVGGTVLLAADFRSGELLRITTEKPILDADLSDDGCICYSSSEAGYKSVLAVYNRKQQQTYRWLSSSTYMPLCAVKEGGKELCAIGLNQSNGVFESDLTLFRTDSEQIIRTVSLGNQLIYDLMYLNENTLCAIGESDVRFFDSQGEALGVYEYAGSYLKDFDAGGEGYLALSMNLYRAGGRYSLVTVDETGAELASVYVGQEIYDLSACGKYIAVLTQEGVTVYTSDLEVYASTEDVGSADAVLMQDDGSVLLLGTGAAERFIP